MPGRQWVPFWEGNRSELFATYVLSSVAQVVPVPHQFDLGLDLLCTLTRMQGKNLYAGRAFGVQVKSASNQAVRYGGLDDQGVWKTHEVDWLFHQDQPIILCIVDQVARRVSLYSTVRIWYLLWQVGKPGEVTLVPGLGLEAAQHGPTQGRYPDIQLRDPKPGEASGASYSYKVPLGDPIFEITLDTADAQDIKETLRLCLNPWVELDYRNIRHREMGVPYVEECLQWTTNKPPKLEARIWYFWNPSPDRNIGPLLASIAPAANALFQNLEAQHQHEKAEAIVPIMRLADSYGVLDPQGQEWLLGWDQGHIQRPPNSSPSRRDPLHGSN